jgi:UDP-N-acetylmuramoylalanine--D-glutamate ligase
VTLARAATALVEGVTEDGAALARLLVAEGETVRLAGRVPGVAAAPGRLDELRAQGVQVEPDAVLDLDPGAPSVAFLDVWTPETAPRVARLRAAGTRLSCLADLVLARAPGPVIGVTGTAGKTITAALTAGILRADGRTVGTGAARAGNLWPTGELLESLASRAPSEWLVLELTSSHLAFTSGSPHVAVVTSFWPDHLELHGSLAAYRAAKERLVASQVAGDWVVVDADEPAVRAFAERTPARRASFSRRSGVERGAFLDAATIRVRWDGREHDVCAARELPLRGRLVSNALAACTAALAAGVRPQALAGGLIGASLPPYRGAEVARWGAVPVLDAGAAATPGKVAALLEPYADSSIVLIAGGETELGGLPVHASGEERRVLEAALAEVTRAARAAVVFGPAAGRLAASLAELEVERVRTLGEAIGAARSLAPGAEAVLFAPIFPVALDDRERFAALAVR